MLNLRQINSATGTSTITDPQQSSQIRTPMFAIGNIGESLDHFQAADGDETGEIGDGILPLPDVDSEPLAISAGGGLEGCGDSLEASV